MWGRRSPTEGRADGPAAASCRRSATSRRPTSPGPRTARRCARRSARSGASSAGRTRSVIGGREVDDGRTTFALARPGRPLARRRPVPRGTRRARRARRSRPPGRRSPAWSRDPGAASGPAVLVRAAAILRRRRFELAAWEVFECGKPWREADGDVAEAIDFCEFYAREMIRLAEPRRRDVPGETNAIEHDRPRASPWSSRPGTSRWRSRPA